MNNYIKKIILITSDYLSIFIATYLTASLIENIVISKFIMFFILFIFIFYSYFSSFYLLGNYSYINKFFKTSNVIRIIIGIVISFILLGSLNLVISHFQIKIYFRDTYLLSPKFTIINMCLIGFLIINSRFLLSLFSKIRAKEQINFWENKKRIYVYGAEI